MRLLFVLLTTILTFTVSTPAPAANATRSTSLVLDLPELVLTPVTFGGESYQLLSIPGGNFEGEPGMPAIPIFSRFVAVPEGARVSARLVTLDEDEITGVRLAPMAPADTRDLRVGGDAARAPRPAPASPDVLVGKAGRIRDLEVVPLTIRSVSYDATTNTARVARRVRIELTFDGGSAPLQRAPAHRIPGSFDRLYRELVLNYDEIAPLDSRATPGNCLIITPNIPAVQDVMAPLVAWRTRQGRPTMLVTTEQTGRSKEEIKAYIQSVYDDPNVSLEYVVLVGDAAGAISLATWRETLSGGNGEGDLPYSQTAGDDALPDVHIGRLSTEDLPTLAHIVDKIIGYETAPYLADSTWFTRSCLVGDPGASGWSTVETARWTAERLAEIGYTAADTIFADPFPQQMQSSLIRGVSLFGYRGYLGMSGWSNGWTITTPNGWKLPFVSVITCDTGSFAAGTSIAEWFVRAWYGTPGLPRGAIGAIGMATQGTHTRYNNCLYMGIWRGIREGLTTMGAARTRGCVEMYLNFADADPAHVQIWAHWANLMGDPAVDVWTGVPRNLTVDHPSSLARGVNSVALTVTDGVSPVEGAVVCLWKDTETYVVGITDAGGAVELPVATPTEGSMLLTVTGHNFVPYQATVPVTAAGLYLGYAAATIDDDGFGESEGNGDGIINPGETIELPVQLQNTGSEIGAGITATLSTDDPFITVADGSESFVDISGGGSAWTTEDFGFTVARNCPHGHVVAFDLEVDAGGFTGHSRVEIAVTSARLVATATTIDDGGNGVLDPGENAALSVLLRNDGGAEATATGGTLISLSPRVQVMDDAGDFGTIAAGASGENTLDRFSVSADPATYDGYLANLLILTSFSGGTTDTTHVALTVGTRVSSDPVGPDAYGYLAYDNTDTGYPEAPAYAWIELDPAFGGDGTEIVLDDFGDYQDAAELVNLPFPFAYYGRTYTDATICSNGWLSFGSTILTSYRNWTMPGAGGPNALVAAFWDDLYRQAGVSTVLQKYDEANHRWIVEWSRMRNASGATNETFELILYDPAYHPTGSGDGIILLQYAAVVNNDTGDGYATVGIENPDQSDGLLYTYFNRYAAGAATLATGRAIRFVPMVEAPAGTAVSPGPEVLVRESGLEPGRPNPFTGGTRIVYRVAQPGRVELAVYDVYGRHITTLVRSHRGNGEYAASWDGRNGSGAPVSAGVYFVRFTAPGTSAVERLTLLR